MTTSSHPLPSEADQEALSAYLDNALSAAERLTIERRLQQEPSLQAELRELRAVKSMIGDLQPVVPSRSFTLDPATVGRPRGMPLFAMLRLGGALATILLALTLTLDVFGSSRTTSAPVAAPQAMSAAQPTSGFAPQAAPAPASNAAISQAPASGAGASPPVANSEAATVAPAAAAPMARADIQATAPAAADLQSQKSPQATAPAMAAAEQSSATDATQAIQSQPAIGAQPPAANSSDTSSPDTNRTALPPPPAASVGISALRWAELILAAFAIACGLGAFLAWQQRR